MKIDKTDEVNVAVYKEHFSDLQKYSKLTMKMVSKKYKERVIF